MLSSELQTNQENLPQKEDSKPPANEHHVKQTATVAGPVEVQSKQGHHLY